MRWVPVELHSHTVHSDGAMTPETLAEEASRAGFQALALTDHNTDSGRGAFTREAESRGLVSLPGVELTTFFGHVLVWGSRAPVDWRVLGPSDLGPALASWAHRGEVALGTAHPFRPGNPFCTGCYWEYDLPFDDLDCLEVWSGVDPDQAPDNARALALWDRLLDQGTRITATAGRDWHRADPVPGLRSATFLGVPDGPFGADDLVRSLRAGRACPSLGPLPQLTWGAFGIGDRVDPTLLAGTPLTFGAFDSGWGLALDRVESPVVSLVSNRGVLAQHPLGNGDAFSLEPDGGARAWTWIRVEVRGRVGGRDRLLALGNPVYGAGSLGKVRSEG